MGGLVKEIQNVTQEVLENKRAAGKISCPFCVSCVQQSWTTLAGVSPVTVIASEPCS